MKPLDLIEAARDLTESGRGRPTQARLRRAVSTAYYAVCPLPGGNGGRPVHRPTAQPGMASGVPRVGTRQGQKRVSGADDAGVPGGSPRFRRGVRRLERARQEADYALDTDDYQQSDVLAYIASAELAIGQFEEADVEARRGFAAHALFRQRPS